MGSRVKKKLFHQNILSFSFLGYPCLFSLLINQTFDRLYMPMHLQTLFFPIQDFITYFSNGFKHSGTHKSQEGACILIAYIPKFVFLYQNLNNPKDIIRQAAYESITYLLPWKKQARLKCARAMNRQPRLHKKFKSGLANKGSNLLMMFAI